MQTTDQLYKSDLTSEQLQTALPTLIAKLRELNDDLSGDDKEIFAAIINSATEHASFLQATNGTVDTLQFCKPISAIATMEMRKIIMELPESVGVQKPHLVGVKQ